MYYESVVRDFKGPKLFAPIPDINHLKTVINPVTTVAQKTAPMFAYYMKTHVLLNADII